MKKLINRMSESKKWIILFIASIIFFTLMYYLIRGQLTEFDSFVYIYINKVKSPCFTKFVVLLTQLGGYIVLCVIGIILTITLKNKKEKLFVWLSMGGSAGLNYILKNIFTRERPEKRLIIENGYSFPSGHSAVSMAFYSYLIYLAYNKIKNAWIKWIIVSILSLTILLIGFSRIYLGVHFASDVIAGFCVGIIYTICFTHILYMKK